MGAMIFKLYVNKTDQKYSHLMWEQTAAGTNVGILLLLASISINSNNNDSPGLSRTDLTICAYMH